LKRSAIAAFLLSAAASAAWAQAPAVPEPKCEPKPSYPGLKNLKSDAEVKAFEGQIKTYKECIMQFIADRKSSAKAHEAAGNAAVDEHNKVMDRIRVDQEAARADAEKAKAPEKKDNVTNPSTKKQ
jgi:hypothetical protein